ncbi:molybdenum ABC transporter ATP-binding protein [Rodentibacter caecimuris]|uniref:Molybdenum ABC transporter ATP-binding protein n=1 Tax=Rodentibacter caecimuris TaxID=1796644 RepID=A0A9X8VZR0_9PAST|nr:MULTISPECIES: molybdenum ABC transporter ATP-binding protein ModC [Pasteurellaceae]MCQ9122484.1 molybdenum ABC transporter ATP-binding protein ModC [Rodentibacter heylii]MCR1836364.1 molybdenum ABC transporter ATP-binding protein ModC [Pasteurella caecimuris]MCU0105885.1 molybdenum ABC transporter ATP-binding protein ModC [Pasteurella caecimuris]MCX2962154.1 molybdenum ABC transporter ATP-binding protein ModC [Rodentibacter heylii]OOF72487.1 molybdenum ABC transporter ATP-binding protein [R
MLQINVKKQLGQLALQVNLSIPEQGVTAVFGLSGSGKTSLINLVAGLIQPDEGFIRLNDRTLVDIETQVNIAVHQRKIGYVFQDARLFPHYNVKGNLCYGMKNIQKEDFDYIVELLGIRHLLKRYPLTLSGGEKQRVAIGRALLTDPEILLMDEPLSALDMPRKRELMQYLERLSQEINIPILYVTHSLDELLRLADLVVLMENGKVKTYDSVERIWNSSIFAPWKEENEQSSVLALPVHLHNPPYKMTALSLGEQSLWINQVNTEVGELVRICIYSSDVSIALQKSQQTSIRNILQGQIAQIDIQDSRVDIALLVEGHKIWASISKWAQNELRFTVGMNVYVQIKAVSVV